MRLIDRDILHKIEPFINRDEFISITGPRQSGKTTFLEILKNHLVKKFKIDKGAIKIITFEDRRLLMEFDKDPLAFIRSFLSAGRFKKSYILIDEFQYAEKGGQKLKFIFDTLKGVKIIVTGSSSLDIKANVGKFMVGRMVNFSLHPFNFREYLRAHNKRLEEIYNTNNYKVINATLGRKKIGIKKGEDLFYQEFISLYEKFVIWGGYPVSVLTENIEQRKKLLGDIYNNYILKDIKTLLELATERNLFLLSQYLATQIGSVVVYYNLGQASGLDYRNVKKHLRILEETFICKEVRPFFRNPQKELSKNPKIYFIDTGFRNTLLENTNSLEKRSDAGFLIENACFIRLNEFLGEANKINFWRTKAGAEVDFVLHTEDGVLPIEIKYSEFKKERLSKSLSSFIDSFNPKNALVLTKNYWSEAKKDNTRILFAPLYYL